MRRVLMLSLAVLLSSFTFAEELRLGRYYTDHMVLQRDKVNVIRGVAPAGAVVQLSFAGQDKKSKANEAGIWEVSLAPLAAKATGGDLSVTSGGARAVITDVVVGDVIFFGRQTTIDLSLGRDEAGKKAAASLKKNPRFRAISLTMIPAAEQQADLAEKATAGWCAVDEASALKMASAAFHLGRDLAESMDVPVGIIDVNMGLNFPISWLSRDALAEKQNVYGGNSVDSRLSSMEEKKEGFTTGEAVGAKKRIITEDPLPHPLYPSSGYNAVIHPLRRVGLKGIIAQIGNDYPYMYYESLRQAGKPTDREALNEAYKKTYDIRKEGFRMEPATVMRIPRVWRSALGDSTVPFAFVQPPASALWTYAVHNCEMRELQRMVTEQDPSVGLILPGMEAIPFSGQPKDEALLAARCLKWVKGSVYNDKDVQATGPVYDRIETDGVKATVYFKAGTAKGLKAVNGTLKGFEVANVEAEYVPAKAVIDGETVTLTCDKIDRIFHVRYNYNENPAEELVNSVGLPALPFRTEKAGHRWLVRFKDDDLPEEYFTPANQWKGGAVTLINGQLEKVGYSHFSGWLGPVGVKTGPFGPNMGVREVQKGSPADGKLLVGDVIYSANGKMLGEEEEMTMAVAITDSEAKDGKLVLGVHRDGRNMDVAIQLAVMGKYSATSPWNCLKTEKIVSNLEKYLARRGAPSGYLYTGQMFMLGAGSPEYQWLVRQEAINKSKLGAMPGDNWSPGYQMIYLCEYYLSTGDKRVLPRIQELCNGLRDLQIKEDGGKRCGGWYGRGGYSRSYPEMVHCALSAMLGMTLAKECGVEVDAACYGQGIAFLERKGAPVGQIIYGDAFRSAPAVINPQEMLAGKLETSNGKVAEAAILYNLIGDKRSAYINSMISTYSWYSTRQGHGGNFWNDFWTPLGAAAHNKEAYIYFMEKHRWYRECHRSYDGSLLEQDRFGGGCGVALVVPRQRLRILGAPKSPFAVGSPEVLKPALAAYAACDYKKSEELATALLADASLTVEVTATIGRLAAEAKRMQQGISLDMVRMDSLIKDGCLYEAGLMLDTLTPIMPESDPALASVKEKLKNGKARANDKEMYLASMSGSSDDADEANATSADDLKKIQESKAAAAAAAGPVRTWQCLTPKEFIMSAKNKKPSFGETSTEEASKWRMLILEERATAPEGWMKPGFDDSGWIKTLQPISWHLNHTTLHRTTFTIKDRKAFDLLRFSGWLFRQQDVEIYLNGSLMARVNNLEGKSGTIDAEFKKAAVELLKDGENTLAIGTRHSWRWGMLGMRVYNDGFDFMLDARLLYDEARDNPKKADKEKPKATPKAKAPAKATDKDKPKDKKGSK